MLDQLVESKNTSKENKAKNGLLLVVMALVFGGFVSALGYSLFTQDLSLSGEGLELSTLVAPPIPEEAPPPVEEEPEQKQQEKTVNADVRKELIANIFQTPPKEPPKISTDKFDKKTINPDRPVMKGDRDLDSFDPTKERPNPTDLDDGFSKPGENNPGGGNDDKGKGNPTPTPPPRPTPPPPPTPKKEEPPKVPTRISGGVVNGKATSLPKPAYPAAAKAANIKGSVNVAIVISKSGSVMSASATSGHPLLRPAAVAAARGARFAPTLLSGQAVEVSGVIVYNFQ